MKEIKDVKRVAMFVDIDCLFDTRIATLFTYYPQIAQELLYSGYSKRQVDNFGVDPKILKDHYFDKSKNREILKNVMITPVAKLIKDYVICTRLNVVNNPDILVPEIILNIHPFDLNQDEQKVILDSLRNITDEICDIQIVSMTDEEISPIYLHKNIATIVKYNYPQWLELHSTNNNFKKTMCPTVTLLGPAVFFEKPPTPLQLKEYDDAKMTPFRAMEIMSGPFISLKLLPIETFCLALSLDLKKPDDKIE